jgi:hypothetical protein
VNSRIVVGVVAVAAAAQLSATRLAFTQASAAAGRTLVKHYPALTEEQAAVVSKWASKRKLQLEFRPQPSSFTESFRANADAAATEYQYVLHIVLVSGEGSRSASGRRPGDSYLAVAGVGALGCLFAGRQQTAIKCDGYTFPPMSVTYEHVAGPVPDDQTKIAGVQGTFAADALKNALGKLDKELGKYIKESSKAK